MTMALSPNLPPLQTPTSSWTHPDNIWITPNSSNLVISCDVCPELRPAGADHLPILTKLNLTITRPAAKPTRNFCTANFEKVCAGLKTNLDLTCPARLITSSDDFNSAVDLLIMTIQEVIESEIPLSNPSPHSK
ncbi:hypothetical protein FIBSPDRAFT_765833 [Athelia psychrophila]|uniref:Endonuclease/exonuclease/phosphatase domain-containing protein n=1 Tax=Athelia psychrophila TaxID=1759441 RepID=A0A167VWH1_9AGAM|nr:hypothetical protein FIBSPDRAFT_765833 [Fibularhizoctonia sp. CBS 109695]